MSLTTQQFLSTLGRGITSKASATRKVGNQTRTVVLRTMPKDMTDDAFLHTARTDGVDASIKEKTDDDRTKTANGKELYGDDAQALACDVLGIPVPEVVEEKPAHVNRIRKRAAVPTPSENAAAPTDGVAIS